MIFFRRISGNSMMPTLRHGDVIVGWNSIVRINDIVIARHKDREIIKRCVAIKDGEYYLEGDNRQASTDSREFGFVKQSAILGVMKLHFATATDAPKIKNKRLLQLTWLAALVMIFFAVIHLFRIDTFVPLLDLALPGGKGIATFFAVSIVTAEVFAVPFLLRMKLSRLARYLSAVFTVLVPFAWLLISVWAFNRTYASAQFGEFYTLSSSWILIILNTCWLFFNYFLVGVMQPNWFERLRKH